MTSAEPFRTTVRSMLRDRLFDAAAGVFADLGWRNLTMAKIADRAGVSRQTVYNEFGTKQQLAELLVMREVDGFLDVVRQSFEEETVFVEAVRSALRGALEAAEKNALLRSVLESGHIGDTDLLPFITQSQGLIDRATEFLFEQVITHFPDLALRDVQLAVALESVVRLVLSHVTQPSRSPKDTADDLAWLVEMILRGVEAGSEPATD